MTSLPYNLLSNTTLAFWTPGPLEFAVLAVLGLLLFGRRLPEVGRGLGRSIVEFRKGIKGIEDEIENESSASSGPRGTLPNDPPPPSAPDSANHAPAQD